MAEDKKNTLKNTSSTKPQVNRVPFKNPVFGNVPKPPKFAPKFTMIRNQNRGSGGK